MVKIQTIHDITSSSIPDSIKEYLLQYIQSILKEYQVNSLSKFGCIYLLETPKDTQDHQALGLRLPLRQTPFEYSEIIPLKDIHGEFGVLHGCFVFNNDFAIDIFGRQDIFDSETQSALLNS